MTSITESIRQRMKTLLSVDYDGNNDVDLTLKSQQEVLTLIDNRISFDWIKTYQLQCAMNVSILKIPIGGYTYFWDDRYERVVAVYGIVKARITKKKIVRDSSRIAYYYRNFIKKREKTSTDT